MRRHVYNFKFKEDTSEAAIQEIIDAFEAEYNSNKGMTHFSMGQNISESKRPKRFNWIMTMDFETYEFALSILALRIPRIELTGFPFSIVFQKSHYHT